MFKNKQKVFVVTPLNDNQRQVIKALRDNLGLSYEIFTSEDMPGCRNIVDDIMQGILSADVIIADVTGNNSNVMYELGVAHCAGRKVIMITQDSRENLAFDIRQYRTIRYSLTPDGLSRLIAEIERTLLYAQDNEAPFSNPVSDYIASFYVERNSLQVPSIKLLSTARALSPVAKEQGLLDYAADMEESTEIIQKQMAELTEDANKMRQNIMKHIQEAQQAKMRGVPMTASFVREQAKKIARSIKVLSDSIDVKNEKVHNAWIRAKEAFQKVCSSPIFLERVDAEGIEEVILQKLPSVDKNELKVQLQELKIGLRQLNGFQKDLTRAAHAFDVNLTGLISTYDSMLEDIDEIREQAQQIAKSKNNISKPL